MMAIMSMNDSPQKLMELFMMNGTILFTTNLNLGEQSKQTKKKNVDFIYDATY